MSDEELVLRISGDSSGGQAAVQGQADAIDKATTSVDSHTEALRKVTEATQEHVDLLPGFISKYIEARTIYDLAKTAYEDYIELIKGSVEAYGEAEQAEVRLSAALKNTGAEEAADAYAHYAEQLSESTVVSKTAGLEAAGTFTLIGKVGPESMNAAMQAAADFSAGTGRSMESATLAIAKASDGNVGQLKRFGIEIDAERAKTEGIGYIIDAVTQKFGGQAEALSGTLLGSWKQMGNQWEVAEEQLGQKIAPAVIALGHAVGAVIGIVSASPEAFIGLVAASTALAGAMAWMAATSVYGAQFSRLAAIIGGELTANVTVFNGVALTTEGSVLGLAAAETTAADATVLASGSILGLSEAAAVAAPAVAATATSVGVLGAALPVVVVAMAAWMVGKWLGDITGLTDAIRKWASAGGDAALAAETTAAKQDVINRAVQLGAPATIAYGDAVAYVNAAFARSQVVMPDATQLLADWNAKVQKAYDQAQAMKVLVDAIKNQPGFVEGSSFDFAGEEEAAKKAKEAAQQFLKVLADVASAGTSWQDTLNTMDGGVVAWSLHLLDMGVSLDTVRKYYGLTEAQAKALEDQQKFLASTVSYSTTSFIAHAGGVGLVQGGYIEASRALTGLNEDGTLASYVIDDVTGKFVELGPTIYSATDQLKAFRTEEGQTSLMSQALQDSMNDLPKIIERSFEGGGGLMGVATAGGADLGKHIGASIKTSVGDMLPQSMDNAIGGALGSIAGGIGGSLIQMGVTKLVSFIAGLFGDHTAEDVARDAGQKFGTAFSDGTTKAITADVQSGMSEVAAELNNLDKIINDAGGITAQNVGLMTARFHDLFSMLQTGQLTSAQVNAQLTAGFPALAAASTDALGRWSDGLKEIIKLDGDAGTANTAIAAALKGQGSDAMAGFVAVTAGVLTPDKLKIWDDLKQKLSDADDEVIKLGGGMGDYSHVSDEAAQAQTDAFAAVKAAAADAKSGLADLGTQAVASFAAAVASGTSETDALTAIHPALASLEQAYSDLGLSVDDVALSSLMMRDKIVTAAPQMISGISGLSKEMIALDNMGLLNVSTFGAMQRSGQTMYEQLSAQVTALGGTDADTLSEMQSYLHTAADEATKLGIPLDDNTQKLIDQSKTAGIWQDAMTPDQKLLDTMQSLVDKVSALVDTLNHVPAKVTTTITTTHEDVYAPPTGYGQDNAASYAAEGGYVTPFGVQYLAGGGAVRNMGDLLGRAIGGPRGTDTQLAWLTPGESVLNTDATAALGLNAIGALNRGARSGTLNLGNRMGGSGVAAAAGAGGAGIVMHNTLDFSGSIIKDRDSMHELADEIATILHDKARAVSQLSLRRSR